MKVAGGTRIAGGIAIGQIKWHKVPTYYSGSEDRFTDDPEKELARLEEARQKVLDSQKKLHEIAMKEGGQDSAAIFEIHGMLLEDPQLVDGCKYRILEFFHSAEYAVEEVFGKAAAGLEALEDPIFRTRAADITDLKKELLAELMGNTDRKKELLAELVGDPDREGVKADSPGNLGRKEVQAKCPGKTDPGKALTEPPASGYILAAQDLLPSELMKLDKVKLSGLVLAEGSADGHMAVLAKSMNLPTIIRCGELSEEWDGRDAILDAVHGQLYIEPSEETKERFLQEQEAYRRNQELLKVFRDKETVTKDGHRIKLYANVAGIGDLDRVLESGAEGIGLFRTEFLYLNAEEEPSEEAQFQAYKRAAESLAPRPVIIRTCDIGADKIPDYMIFQTASKSGINLKPETNSKSGPNAESGTEANPEKEENPALGLRGVRFCLADRDFFKRQLRAILRASVYGNVGVMFPMIANLWEVKACKELLSECRSELEGEGFAIGAVKVGIMVETPAAALCADELAKEVDFFSLGTNDLTQYTCAADRQNGKLTAYATPGHPAVLKLIKLTVDAAHRNRIPVGICGELAANPEFAATFLKMGVDELSLNPASILKLRQRICEMELWK